MSEQELIDKMRLFLQDEFRIPEPHVTPYAKAIIALVRQHDSSSGGDGVKYNLLKTYLIVVWIISLLLGLTGVSLLGLEYKTGLVMGIIYIMMTGIANIWTVIALRS